MNRDRLADALMGADVATWQRLAEERAIVADTIERMCTTRGEPVPESVAAQANDHRIVAGVLLAVAEMQERDLELLSRFPHNGQRKIVNDLYLGDDDVGLVAQGDTLPAALAELLRSLGRDA